MLAGKTVCLGFLAVLRNVPIATGVAKKWIAREEPVKRIAPNGARITEKSFPTERIGGAVRNFY